MSPTRWLAMFSVGTALLVPAAASAQPDDVLSRVSARDIAESLLALNNLTTAPGLEGSNLKVDPEDGNGTLDYNRASFQIPMSIPTRIDWLNVHIDLGIGSLFVDDRFNAVTAAGESIFVNSDRTITSGRVGIGPGFTPIEGLYIATYFTGAFSGMNAKSQVTPAITDIPGLTPIEEVLLQNWKSMAWSVGGVFDATYVRWLRNNRHRVDFQLRYAASYSETINESLAILNASGVSNTLSGELIFRTITDLSIFKKKLAWNVFTTAGGFPGQDADDLGFTYNFGFGAGIDLYFPEKIFGVLDRNFIGVRGSALVGDNNHGWSLVVHLRR